MRKGKKREYIIGKYMITFILTLAFNKMQKYYLIEKTIVIELVRRRK